MMFFKLMLIEIKKELLKKKKILIFFVILPFIYFLYSLNSLPLSTKALIYHINSYFILYSLIILFSHINVLCNFINNIGEFSFYAVLPIKREYVLFSKLCSTFFNLMLFLLSLFFFAFILFKNIYLLCIPLLYSIFFVSILFLIVSLFSFFKYPHFPIFSFVFFYLLGTLVKGNLSHYRGKLKSLVYVISKLLPPFSDLVNMNLNTTDIFIGLCYIICSLILLFVISKRYEFKNFIALFEEK